jgi:hypothetical protein
VVALDLKQGAITFPSATPDEPTPNIYEQLLATIGTLEQHIAVERGRVNQLVAMRSAADSTWEYYLDDEYFSGTIVCTGANAYIDIVIKNLSLIAGGQHYSDYYADAEALMPLTDVELHVSNSDLNVTLLRELTERSIRILIENVSSNDYHTEMVTFARATYPTLNVYIPELGDLRTTYDGYEYDDAGTAVRQQIEELNNKVGSGGGGGGGVAPRLSSVTLSASKWSGGDSLYSQVVTIAGVTKYTKVDLLPSVEQLAVFYNKNVTFVTENEDGVVTVYAIGEKPLMDHTIQVQLTEVVV